jgi:hypothetical protein
MCIIKPQTPSACGQCRNRGGGLPLGWTWEQDDPRSIKERDPGIRLEQSEKSVDEKSKD